MSQNGNAFQKAANTLAEVHELVLKGDELRDGLAEVIGQAEASTKRVEQALMAETAALSKSTQEVLGQYKSTARDITRGIAAASEQLEATTAEIKATAITAVTELNDKADIAIKRVVAEVTIAQDRFERAAKAVEGAAGRASEQIVEASQRVDRGTSLHSGKLEDVSRRTAEVLIAFDAGVKAIVSAERDIRLARDETTAARLETARAKDEVVALRESMRKQVRYLTIAVTILFVTALGAVAWTYLRTRGV